MPTAATRERGCFSVPLAGIPVAFHGRGRTGRDETCRCRLLPPDRLPGCRHPPTKGQPQVQPRIGGAPMTAPRSAAEALLYLSQQATRPVVRGWLEEHPDAVAAFERRGTPPRWPADRLRASGIRFVTFGDDEFPAPLRHIPDPPLALYYRGNLQPGTGAWVAVVGARAATRRGMQIAEVMGRELSSRGATVVSGLARGIDGAAHRGALNGDGGGAWAVLGSGLLDLYPRQHTSLAERIVECGGALLSEYVPDAAPLPGRFPERNRLISGLCEAVVVVEASRHSGSLITARMAGEQGRDVMAVPGPAASPLSAGCHWLIKQGGVLVEDAADVLGELGYEVVAGAPPPQPPPNLMPVYEAVTREQASPDEIAVALGMPVDAVTVALVQLELAGFVRLTAGGYIRAPC